LWLAVKEGLHRLRGRLGNIVQMGIGKAWASASSASLKPDDFSAWIKSRNGVIKHGEGFIPCWLVEKGALAPCTQSGVFYFICL
jgi:hypothetical protein